jgi:hypothetical protein
MYDFARWIHRHSWIFPGFFFLRYRRETSKEKQNETHRESSDHNNKILRVYLPGPLFIMPSCLRMRIPGTKPSPEQKSGIWTVHSMKAKAMRGEFCAVIRHLIAHNFLPTEHRDVKAGMPASLGCSGCESGPEHWLSLLKLFLLCFSHSQCYDSAFKGITTASFYVFSNSSFTVFTFESA